MNKVAFWLLYFFRRVQCSLTWHLLQADMPDMCNEAGTNVSGTKTWLACSSVS